MANSDVFLCSSNCTACPSRKHSLIHGLYETTAFALSALRQSRLYEEGEVIPPRLDGHEGFHVVRSGTVKVSFVGAKSRVVRIKGPGRIVGFGRKGKSDFLVHALEEVETCFFAYAGFGAITCRDPQLLANVVSCLDELSWEDGRRLFGLEGASVRYRVASVLLYLEREFGAPSNLGTKISLVVERAVYAELAGTTPESFARCLTELELEGAVARRGWEIHITNFAKLRHFAELRS